MELSWSSERNLTRISDAMPPSAATRATGDLVTPPAARVMTPPRCRSDREICWSAVAARFFAEISALLCGGDSVAEWLACWKLVAALLRVAGVTAGLAESNGSLLSGL